MKWHGPVLAATDFSEASREVLRQGHALAASLGTQLLAVHVLPEAYNVRPLFPQNAGFDLAFESELRARAATLLGAQLDTLFGANAGVGIEIDSGSPHGGILEVAQRVEAGVIVVGPGATATRTARAAGVPVLVARPSPGNGCVLGATDLSDPAVPALRVAAREAARRGVNLLLLHCLDVGLTADPAAAAFGGLSPHPTLPPAVIAQLESIARAKLETALAAAGTPGELLLVQQTPIDGVVETARARSASLVVVGTHGRTGLSRFALGSVAEAVMDGAPCAVMVVPLAGEAAS